jgi:hypothetical protein
MGGEPAAPHTVVVVERSFFTGVHTTVTHTVYSTSPGYLREPPALSPLIRYYDYAYDSCDDEYEDDDYDYHI